MHFHVFIFLPQWAHICNFIYFYFRNHSVLNTLCSFEAEAVVDNSLLLQTVWEATATHVFFWT